MWLLNCGATCSPPIAARTAFVASYFLCRVASPTRIVADNNARIICAKSSTHRESAWLRSRQQHMAQACTDVLPRETSEETLVPTTFGADEMATAAVAVSSSISRYERKAARRNRSFRRRQAPITKRQRAHLRDLFPKHGLSLNFKERWNFGDIFAVDADAAVTLDIGFGGGESLLEMASRRPDECFVGIEVHKPGVAKALERLEAEPITNARVILGDAITALCDHVEDRALTECCIFFPEPFPLARDAERRLVRPLLLALLSRKLRPGGFLNVATDVEEYAEHVIRVMSPVLRHKADGIRSGVDEAGAPLETARAERSVLDRLQSKRSPAEACWTGGEMSERPPWRPVTRYEQKARAAGRRVRDFRYRLD